MNALHSLCAAALLAPLAAAAGNLELTVTGGPEGPAELNLALYSSADTFHASQALASQRVPMRNGQARLVFADLPPGRYAVRAFADENGNQKLDSNLFGVPSERYGFSNDARGTMGPPAFEAAAFAVEADVRGTLQLR